jgi:putative transposase
VEKAYKFRLYPNNEQIQLIQQTFGCCRYIFNHFLSKRIALYQDRGDTLNYNACSAGLTELKKELDWLRQPDATALQSALKDLDVAYQNFFRRVKKGEKPGFPHFKSKKNRRKSYKSKRVGENIALLERHIKLPKLGLVRVAVSKQVKGRILNVTVSQSPSGKYYVSICCTDVDIEQYPATGASVGLDMGLTDLAVTSDGENIPNHKHLRESEVKLAKAQRELSRKTIGSNNWDRARIKVARLQERVVNRRIDSLQKLTTEIVRNYDIICIEDLNIRGMVRNHRLAKSISDASWGELARQLGYKCEWHGKTLIKVDRFFASSQICGECGAKNEAVKNLSVREWGCMCCGAKHNRDRNAAKNILNEGLRLLA